MKSLTNPLTSPRPGTVPGVGTIYTNRSVTVQGAAHQYQLGIPANYVAGTKIPLIIGFSGSVQSGHDNTNQMTDYPGLYLTNNLSTIDSIIVCPQRHDSAYRTGGGQQTLAENLDASYAIIQDVAGNWDVDRKRIYGFGASAGMADMFYFAGLHPELFAAIAGGSAYPFAVNVNRFNWGSTAALNADAATLLGTRIASVPCRLFNGSTDGTMHGADQGDAAAVAFAAVMTDFTYTQITTAASGQSAGSHVSGYRVPMDDTTAAGILPWFKTKVNPRNAW